MKNLKSYEIRQMWLDFFASKGHKVVPSASLIPVDDPTLLWINAGVAPLKKYFDGREKPENPRLCNAQKSLRTNDIENVGKTARHHTFFEMLGNFSIGDYFRNEALEFANELLFDEKWFAIPRNLIYITYYPEDKDTYNKWVSLGVDPTHLVPIADNFWEIGEGPCGPDTEIFFDRGEKYDPNGLGIKLLAEDIENDRYIEIWNIVFSQFNSTAGLKREDYPELPSKNIDTGGGLERFACVFQGVETNYETDLFMPMIKYVENLSGIKYAECSETQRMAFRVIVDHIRSVVFALADGAILSNEGRGYVLRRILRRAVRMGKRLGINEPFLYKIVSIVIENMKSFYSYLIEKETIITKLIKIEEENFLKTLESGEKKLNDVMENAKTKTISGCDAFLLYDTFGFPIELTIEAAEDKGFSVDIESFNNELQKQKERARKARNSEQSMNTQNEEYMNYKKESLFDITTLSFIISEWSHPQKKREEISKLYRELVMKNVDEEKIRESKTDFGFVTLEIPNYKSLVFEGGMSLLFPLTTMARMMFNRNQGKTLLEYFSFVPYELMADEVRKGKLAEYIAASANNFIFTPMEIDNKRFTDGGVYDNLPIKMMEDKGYHKFFCIRVSTSELKLKCSDNLDITMITPTEDTGNCAMFNANNIRHLIELGRKDALAFLKTLKGDSYEKIEF